MNIKGTESEENIKLAFALESQARNKYTYFAVQARNEGNDKIADLFETMAGNEREHAKVWYKLLNNGIPHSIANLEHAAESEYKEWNSMYPGFAQKAREEGLELLAIMFDNIAAIEKNHETMFLEILDEIKNNQTAPKKRRWERYVCKNCGHIAIDPPSDCPVCREAESFEKE